MPSSLQVIDVQRFEDDFFRLTDTLTTLTLLTCRDIREAFAVTAEAAAAALQVGRFSLWRYNKGQSAIASVGVWQRGVLNFDGVVISKESHPVYWQRLHERRSLPISDAVNDPALIEFRDEYIPTHGIGALLDSSVRADGVTLGIVCAEHLDGPREWTPLERLFVASVADRLGLAILANEQRQLELLLSHSQKVEALGVMAGGLAHDFNNILSVMLTSSDMALGALEAGDDPTEDVLAIRDTARRAAAMTRRLLTVARREPMHQESLELNSVLREAHDIARRLLPKHVALHADLAAEPYVIRADRAFLDQAMLNLLTNAAQSMPNGGTITVETARLQSDGGRQFGMLVPVGHYVRLSVRDEGGGIDDEALPRVFDPFFTTKGQHGTGLGLAVVYNGMQQHGGLVSVQSATGVGCTFHLLFPTPPTD